MAATFAAIGSYFTAAEVGVAALTAAEVAGTVAATEIALVGAGATAMEAGLAATALGGTMGGGAAVAAGAGGILSSLGGSVASAATSTLLGGLLAPDAPEPPQMKQTSITAMPDPMAQEKARKRSTIEQLSRRGRASTILTQPSGGRLGG